MMPPHYKKNTKKAKDAGDDVENKQAKLTKKEKEALWNKRFEYQLARNTNTTSNTVLEFRKELPNNVWNSIKKKVFGPGREADPEVNLVEVGITALDMDAAIRNDPVLSSFSYMKDRSPLHDLALSDQEVCNSATARGKYQEVFANVRRKHDDNTNKQAAATSSRPASGSASAATITQAEDEKEEYLHSSGGESVDVPAAVTAARPADAPLASSSSPLLAKRKRRNMSCALFFATTAGHPSFPQSASSPAGHHHTTQEGSSDQKKKKKKSPRSEVLVNLTQSLEESKEVLLLVMLFYIMLVFYLHPFARGSLY